MRECVARPERMLEGKDESPAKILFAVLGRCERMLTGSSRAAATEGWGRATARERVSSMLLATGPEMASASCSAHSA